MSTHTLEPPPAENHASSVSSASPEPAHSVGASAFSSREDLNAAPAGFASWLSCHTMSYQGLDQTPLADLIAQYGSSSSTAWLDRERYKIWRPSQPMPESDFTPVQGYMQRDTFVFAWGNPLVSSPAALEKTAHAFIAFAEANHLHPVWCCADKDLERILANGPFGWVTVSCIYEDVMDPEHVIELLGPKHKGKEPSHVADELRKHLLEADKELVEVCEVKNGEWTERDREAVEVGIKEWTSHKHRIELNTMKFEPWLDEQHRRYWIAGWKGKVVGVEILAPTGPTSWQILKCITFNHASGGTTEKLLYTALKNLHDEQEEVAREVPSITEPTEHPPPPEEAPTYGNRLTVSFGVTAADHLEAGHNLSGWKVSVLGKTYHAVSEIAGLIKAGEYQQKYESTHEPMYVCYPPNRFGFLAIGALLMAIRK